MTISSQSLTSTLSYSIQLLSLILFIFSWSSCCWHSFFISLGLRLKCLLIGENFLYSFFGWRTAFSLQLLLLLVTPTPGTTGEVVPSLTAPKAYMESLPHFFFGFRSDLLLPKEWLLLLLFLDQFIDRFPKDSGVPQISWSNLPISASFFSFKCSSHPRTSFG